jgi:hypothetical protein
MKITDDIKSFVPAVLVSNGFTEDLAEPLPLTQDEITTCRWTASQEECFITLSKNNSPVKLAKQLQNVAKCTPKDVATDSGKHAVMVFLAAAYFLRSVIDRNGHWNTGYHNGDYPIGYGLKGKALATSEAEYDARCKEAQRRITVVAPWVVMGGTGKTGTLGLPINEGGKSYIGALNKGITAIERGVTSTLTLVGLKKEAQKKKGKRS